MRASDKAQHRRTLRAARAALPRDLVATRSATACDRLLALHMEGVRTIALYAGSDAHGELDPRPAAARFRARGVRTAYSRVDNRLRLEFRAVTDEGMLRAAPSLGVLEPAADAPLVPLDEIDAFVVPGLGFTARGDRLGFGGGYYDRALAAAPRATRIGFAHPEQLVPTLPVEAHDERVDLVLTPDLEYPCAPRARSFGAQP